VRSLNEPVSAGSSCELEISGSRVSPESLTAVAASGRRAIGCMRAAVPPPTGIVRGAGDESLTREAPQRAHRLAPGALLNSQPGQVIPKQPHRLAERLC